MALYITGDIHGDPKPRFNPALSKLTKEDIVLVCGDFGLPWWSKTYGKHWADKKRLDWLEKQPYTTVFIDGNHENFDLLNKLPIQEWCGGRVHVVRANVFHLMRGEVFDILGLKVLAFGGAYSVDRKYRVLNISWWREEIYSAEDLSNLKQNLAKVGHTVDLVITHTAPIKFLQPKTKEIGIEWSFFQDDVAKMLSEIEPQITYKKWYFGHFHLDWEDKEQRCRGIYTEIDEIDVINMQVSHQFL